MGKQESCHCEFGRRRRRQTHDPPWSLKSDLRPPYGRDESPSQARGGTIEGTLEIFPLTNLHPLSDRFFSVFLGGLSAHAVQGYARLQAKSETGQSQNKTERAEGGTTSKCQKNRGLRTVKHENDMYAIKGKARLPLSGLFGNSHVQKGMNITRDGFHVPAGRRAASLMAIGPAPAVTLSRSHRLPENILKRRAGDPS